MRFVLASDHAGVELKREISAWLERDGREVTDLGTMDAASVDYPDYAHRLARAIASASHERGILICGTGIGMSMAANRHAGVRAALCGDVFSARMTRLHNDANVLCLGARVVGVGLALEILQTFVRTEFEGGRHARRTAKIEP